MRQTLTRFLQIESPDCLDLILSVCDSSNVNQPILIASDVFASLCYSTHTFMQTSSCGTIITS